MRNSEGARCQSIFIFDRFAAGYASGAQLLLKQIFQKAAELLNCPKQCDSSCPNCVLDFDQRFEANVLNRHAALKILSSTWLKMLRLPEELCYFGSSSQAESSTIFEAVVRESGESDSKATRLYANGAPSQWDFAASGVDSSPIRCCRCPVRSILWCRRTF